MDAIIDEEIANKRLPGAVVVVGRKGRVVWRKSYGARVLDPAREPMTPETIFDVASLTKVVATATSIMILVERGKLRLNDPVSVHIPELKGEGRERITIEQLLTHITGYAPDFDLARALDRLRRSDQATDQGTVAQSAWHSFHLQRHRIHRTR